MTRHVPENTKEQNWKDNKKFVDVTAKTKIWQ